MPSRHDSEGIADLLVLDGHWNWPDVGEIDFSPPVPRKIRDTPPHGCLAKGELTAITSQAVTLHNVHYRRFTDRG
jgi:hypothetical protein